MRDDPTPMGGLDAPHLGSEGGARRGAADLYPLKSEKNFVNLLPGNIRLSETGTLFFGPHIPGTKVPMLPEAPAHPSTKVADGVRGSRTS